MTKGLIGSKLKGPGPGAYKLPSSCGQDRHDKTKDMAPAYSFGKNLGSSFVKSPAGPGPVYKVNPEYTRFGKDGTAKYSQQGRRSDLSGFQTPGPGRYNNHKSDFQFQNQRNSEKYSMGSRTRYMTTDAFPASNRYSLPPLMGPKIPNKGASQAYSMTSRRELGSFTQDLSKTPGPARYTEVEQNTYKAHAPKYSMLARRFCPGDKTRKPGPGSYYPEHVNITKKTVPKYSMGIRHSDYITPLIIPATQE